jgi:hypothetical protein
MQAAVLLVKVAFVVLVLVLVLGDRHRRARPFVLLPMAPRFVRAVYRFTCAPWSAKLSSSRACPLRRGLDQGRPVH